MKPRVIVVAKKTSYSQYIEDDYNQTYNETSRHCSKIKDLLLTDNPVVSRWRSAHERHKETLSVVLDVIQSKASLFLIDIPHCAFVGTLQDVALVVTVGGDGTLLSTSHNLHSNIPILGVNSDPVSSVGFFCAANKDNFEKYFSKALDHACDSISLTRMKVSKNGHVVSTRVLNDVLFCHTNPASTSRYILDNGVIESQSSSGFWIGPAAGSTAARRSAGFSALPLVSKSLQLCARELYYRPGFEPGRREVIVEPGSKIRILSKMDNAAMYIDGDHKIVPVQLGDEIIFEQSEETLLVLGSQDVFRQ